MSDLMKFSMLNEETIDYKQQYTDQTLSGKQYMENFEEYIL